ncbi:hypothetical protein D6853_14725 [Butyrivibrio sp. X503]|uniref:hypothetical protein n=1 Tax=Butyrivibrio sp. X503 TaxID=2364878 RepID=UPI000EA9DD77|nr:hypothetical protein [Butyrivibrio sp. X503]RKM53891.1 hypothetical protein D6853_14725 [Butyrivibrio sp. X503]
MNICKKLGSLAVILTVSTVSLFGCSSADRTAAEETVTAFLDIVKSGTSENIEQYASEEVTSGEFVKTFDNEFLIKQLKDGFETEEIDAETSAKVDEFFGTISGMVSGYEISKVTVDKKGKATAIVKINTAFPVNIFGSDETTQKIREAAEAYHAEHDEEIKQLYKDLGDEEADKQLYNKRVQIAMDTYAQIISEATPETYAMVLSLEKNAETDSWYVTSVESFDSSVNGKTETATDTATTAESN